MELRRLGMLNKKSINDINVKGKKVIVRVDFNVPLNKDGSINDGTRLVAAIPTIQQLTDRGAKVILLSHLGRPKGEPNPQLSLEPIVQTLADYLHREVTF